MTDEELLKLSMGELVDLGVCPTCFNRKMKGLYFGDESKMRFYEDSDIEILFVSNPRSKGHLMISTKEHYHDLSEAPDWLNEKIIRFAKGLMVFLKEVFGCERTYLCSMCDGKNNHYHIQLIPRYSFEERGSKNFVKPRQDYVYDEVKFEKMKKLTQDFAKLDSNEHKQ